MTRTLRQVGLFIGGFVVVYLLVLVVLSLIHWEGYSLLQRSTGDFGISGGSTYSLRRLQEVEQKHDLDILFLGSSRCYTSIDTRPFTRRGLNVFNLGTSSQTPLNSLFVMRRYWAKLRPRIVIIELYPTMLGLDGVESYFDLMKNSTFSIEWIRMCMSIQSPHAYNATAGWYLGRTLGFSKRPLVQPVYLEWTYVTDGFTSTPRPFRDDAARGNSPIKWRDSQIESLRSCLRYVRENHAEAVVVIAPIADPVYNSIENYSSIMDQLRDLCGADSALLLDFSRAPIVELGTDYADFSHLNATGAEKFGKFLSDTLWNTPRIQAKLSGIASESR